MLLSQKVIIFGGSIILFWVIFGFVAFQQILKFGIRDQTALRNRNEVRSIYLKIPFPLDFRIYFFNVSNPMEVQNGATPILKEIGPYCYDEYKERIDIIDNPGEDSLTYSPYDIFKFNQERSGELSDEDYVTILNPLVVGMVNHANKTTPAMLSIVDKAIFLIFRDINSIYLTVKVKDILFDGVQIDCRVSEFPAKAVCSQMKSQIPGLKVASKNIFLFSILGHRNATMGKRFKISRGISNSKNLGRLLEHDDKRELTLWATKACNTFKGTDGWIFPPFLSKEEGIWTFQDELCRNMQARFVRDIVFKGVNIRRYEVDLGDMQHNEEEKCYCETPKTCLKKGVFDLSKCMGVPILATLPHFLRADEIYLQQVQGLNPVLEDHIIKIHFEPMTGTPLEARKRLQFNLPIAPNSKITIMNNIPEALHPIFWVEEGVELEGVYLRKVTNVFLIMKIVNITRWIAIVIGIMVVIYGFHMYFKNKKEVKITPVHQLKTVSKQLEVNKISSTSGLDVNKNTDNNTNGKVNSVMSGHEFDRY